MKILVVGKPTYNIVLPISKFIEEGSKTRITEKQEFAGGNAVNTAMLLARWGVEVNFTGVVGSDIYGNKIKSDLDALRINTKYVEINYENPTSFNYIILNTLNGSSTQIIKNNPEVQLSKYKYDFVPDVVIMDGSDSAGCIAALNNYPRAISILLATQVNDEVHSISKRCTYVIASSGFARALTKLDLEINRPKALVAFMQKIKDLNKPEYIVMLRDKGVLYTSERQVKMIPGIKLEKIIDDSHASSIFLGAFSYGIIKGYSHDDAVKMANTAAGLSLTKVGALNSVANLDEVLTMAGIKTENEQTTTEEADSLETFDEAAVASAATVNHE